MRVLMFGWEFPPYQAGGLATATVGLVKGLIGEGVDVTLVVPFPVDHSPIDALRLIGADDAPSDRLVVHRIETPLEPYATAARYQEVYARTRPKAGTTRPIYGRDLLAEVDRYTTLAGEIARREPHDLIDAHDWITFGAGIAAREASGRPLVAHLHATEYDRAGGPGNAAILERERRGLRAADRVICNSHRLAAQCAERFEVARDSIDVVHWGIDREPDPRPAADVATGLGPDTPVVLFLGRVTGQKGPDYFIEMAGRVTRYQPRARFVVAGSGDMLPGLMERAAELGIADRVIFTGGLGPHEVQRVFRLADVCVMPSRNEPFGLVALESLLQGTPCILPKDAGVSEVVQNAFKVDYWDVEAMTDRVVALLKHRVLRRELSERGRAELDLPRFTLAEAARHTLRSYRTLIERADA
ncbi:MAG: glycosyltransferase family 4 protein [Gemmatimonadales bacterium]